MVLNTPVNTNFALPTCSPPDKILHRRVSTRNAAWDALWNSNSAADPDPPGFLAQPHVRHESSVWRQHALIAPDPQDDPGWR